MKIQYFNEQFEYADVEEEELYMRLDGLQSLHYNFKPIIPLKSSWYLISLFANLFDDVPDHGALVLLDHHNRVVDAWRSWTSSIDISLLTNKSGSSADSSRAVHQNGGSLWVDLLDPFVEIEHWLCIHRGQLIGPIGHLHVVHFEWGLASAIFPLFNFSDNLRTWAQQTEHSKWPPLRVAALSQSDWQWCCRMSPSSSSSRQDSTCHTSVCCPRTACTAWSRISSFLDTPSSRSL